MEGSLIVVRYGFCSHKDEDLFGFYWAEVPNVGSLINIILVRNYRQLVFDNKLTATAGK